MTAPPPPTRALSLAIVVQGENQEVSFSCQKPFWKALEKVLSEVEGPQILMHLEKTNRKRRKSVPGKVDHLQVRSSIKDPRMEVV